MKVNMRIGTRILAGYGLALVVVGIVGVVAYRGTTELVDSADLVAHTHKVKEAIFEVRSSLKDAETGQRGFLLTGEDRYLEPYQQGVKAIDLYLQEARELTVDNSNQQKRLNALQSVIAVKLAELAETIAVRRQRGEQAAVQVVLTDKGKKAMDEIRTIIGEMDDQENDLLKRRSDEAKATSHFATSAIIFGGILVLVLISTAGRFIQLSITRPLAEFMQFVGRVGMAT